MYGDGGGVGTECMGVRVGWGQSVWGWGWGGDRVYGGGAYGYSFYLQATLEELDKERQVRLAQVEAIANRCKEVSSHMEVT